MFEILEHLLHIVLVELHCIYCLYKTKEFYFSKGGELCEGCPLLV